MKNYIEIDRIKKDLDFVNLVITTTNVDAKDEGDLLKTLKQKEMT